MNKIHIKSNTFYPINQFIYWLFINNFILLIYIERQVIEPPFITIRQILSVNYFLYFIAPHYLYKLWDKLLITY